MFNKRTKQGGKWYARLFVTGQENGRANYSSPSCGEGIRDETPVICICDDGNDDSRTDTRICHGSRSNNTKNHDGKRR